MNSNLYNDFGQTAFRTFGARGAKGAKVAAPKNRKKTVNPCPKREFPSAGWPTFGILERGSVLVQNSPCRNSMSRNDFEFRRANILARVRCKSLRDGPIRLANCAES